MTPPPPRDRPFRILVVDKDPAIGRRLMLLLGRGGHTCEYVGDGILAWERLSADFQSFDVVITDHVVPNLTGIELVQLLTEANYPGRIIVHCTELSAGEADCYRQFQVAAILEKAAEAAQILPLIGKRSSG